MDKITAVGLDLAKNIFQVHAVDASDGIVLVKRLRRGQVLEFFAKLPPCLVGMEACGTAHHWARELVKLGHEVRLMPPQYVKPYVKRDKNDAADAAAICEAVRRPSMRFVPVKTAEQQAALALHRVRDLLVRQRTMLVNALRAHLAEFGVIAPKGLPKVAALAAVAMDGTDGRVPELLREAMKALVVQLRSLRERIDAIERQIMAWHKGNPVSRRLATIPGIGPIIATAIAATVADAGAFESGRQFAAWLGLVPKNTGTGGKMRQGRISKRGDGYLRRLLVGGALAVIMRSKAAKADPWLEILLADKKRLVVAVALAHKTARIAWAIMTRGTAYRPPLAAA